MANQALLLNASHEPIKTIGLKAALRLVYQNKADLVEGDSSQMYRSERGEMPLPVVIRLKKFVKVPRNLRAKVTNTFLFARDGYRCQYCGRHENELGMRKGYREELNRDHVIPRSKGGENTWENCVTSCSSCNSRKDNKTLKEAGMKLLSNPTQPHLVNLKWAVRNLTPLQRKYIAAFYGEEVLRALR